ncbi:MAG: hypothetical protein OER22_01030 [Gammaproteobacteria bacterium]|nr:hypothetical protein [Gammaproteobacteria bacterium]MDH3372433.1 hypothetical protein [Gammaproteobacteria bacterium]MDH3551175.1 hypothetical protein [Gammaproteobacteria bacterium]
MLDKAERWFRRWFAKVWKVRGGGFYALGFVATFIYLEVTTVAGEFIESPSIGAFLSEQLVEFVFRFAVDSLINTVYAFIWPVYWVQWQPPVGLIALGAGYVIFAKFIKQSITDWLFPDGQSATDDPNSEEASSEESS